MNSKKRLKYEVLTSSYKWELQEQAGSPRYLFESACITLFHFRFCFRVHVLEKKKQKTNRDQWELIYARLTYANNICMYTAAPYNTFWQK